MQFLPIKPNWPFIAILKLSIYERWSIIWNLFTVSTHFVKYKLNICYIPIHDLYTIQAHEYNKPD